MALVDVLKWDANGEELVWKYPSSELSTKTQLIVNESQTAVFFKDGQRFDAFGPGRHTLSTNNIPLLGKFVNLPFSGKSPFAAEVWFVNRAIPLNLKWGMPPAIVEDPQYGILVPLGAFGQMGVQVADPGMLIQKLVGTMRSFNVAGVLDHLRGTLVSQLKTSIVSAINDRRVSILQIEGELVSLSEAIQEKIAPHYQDYGLDVHLFRIMGISFPHDDEGVQKVKRAKATAAQRKIEGITYQQERTFDMLQATAENQGVAGSFAAMGAGVGAGLSVGQVFGSVAAQQLAPQVAPPPMGPPPFPGPGAHSYYIHVSGAQQGPLSFEQMRQAAQASQLTAQTPVWRNGLPAWGRADAVPELAALFGPPGPPPFPG
jgi:membrane protease subunit (stomatin/prohibitin family)